jgi:hypothetical protein
MNEQNAANQKSRSPNGILHQLLNFTGKCGKEKLIKGSRKKQKPSCSDF